MVPTSHDHRSLLEASWQRSSQHGLRRRDRALFSNVISRAQARRIEDENSSLIAVLAPELERLYRALGSAHWLVLYANVNGEVVHAIGDRDSAPRQLRVLMQPGRRLTEAELGTTAPGCALESGMPVVVTRNEHYLLELGNFFCASTPILAPDGKVAGVLDISGLDVQALPLAGEIVNLVARRIENEILMMMSDCVHLRFHFDERMLGTPFEGVLAVHADGTIRGANRVARRLVASGENTCVGQALESVVGSSLESVLDSARRDEPRPSEIQNRWGGVAYLSVIPTPALASVVARSPTAQAQSAVAETTQTPRDLLRAAELQTINRVLKECGGNVSAAARALGISRTTLYSRLK